MMRLRQDGRTGGAALRGAQWVSLAGLVLLSAGAAGASGEPADEEAGQPAVSEEAEPTGDESEAAPPEIFQPTEEISEDYAAPFPVDI